jgi:5-(carboxyamino)imidazole ribonucleotide synthase
LPVKDKSKQKIGIIGGGQLGKMMILAAKAMGFYVTILDPTPDCPAASIADQHLKADFSDQAAIKKLAAKSDLITYEFEHIEVEVLKELEAAGYKIYPTARSLEIIQNKYHQKTVLKQAQIPVPDFIKIASLADLKTAAIKFGYPLMLKSCRGGYDGKGNYLIKAASELETAFAELGAGGKQLLAEKYIPFQKEISVIAARGQGGEMVVYPIAENEHQNNILLTTRVPAALPDQLKYSAEQLAREVLEIFAGVGIFCIEMFVTDSAQLLINEIAPRPHNSGHYSIEGCYTSQFEQHIRAIAGLPLGNPELIRPTVMCNILGSGQQGAAEVIGLQEALKLANVKVHIYQKKISRPGRKMGHLTATASNLSEAAHQASQAEKVIMIRGKEDSQ